jgi:putative sporulation protein YyaC
MRKKEIKDVLLERTHMDDCESIQKLASALKQVLPKRKPVKIVCIGTDRSTGDSLGPLVGYKLKQKGIDVYGTLDEPVHALNLEDYIEQVKGNFVIAIDACLGRSESVGYIALKNEPLCPGSGVSKDLPKIGNASIFGIVNTGGFMEYATLQNTRLNTVMKQADIIASAVEMAVNKC